MTKVAVTEAVSTFQSTTVGAQQSATGREPVRQKTALPTDTDRFAHERIVERLAGAAGVDPLPSTPPADRPFPFPVGATLEFQGEDGWGNDGGRIAVESLQDGLCRLTVSTTGMLAGPRIFEGRRAGDAILGSWSGAYGEQIDVRVLLGPAPVAALDIREIEDEPVYHFELAAKARR